MIIPEFVKSVVVGIIGGGAGGTLLIEWRKSKWTRGVEKFKDELTREMKQFEAKIEVAQLVKRTHVDTEFQAMKEVAQQLAHIKLALRMLNLREEFAVPEGVTLNDVVRQLEEAKNGFQVKLEEWGVFLQREIFDEFERCYIGADQEWKQMNRLLAFRERDDQRERNVQYFDDHYSKACQLIRDRVQSLSTISIPGTLDAPVSKKQPGRV